MSTARDSTLAVILGAGAGSRFIGSTHKLLAPLGASPGGQTVAGAAIRHALDARIGPVLVVTGAVDLAAAVADIVADIDGDAAHHSGRALTTIDNPDWADGQATSLQVAIAEADRQGADAIVVGLADQPFVDPVAWQLVAAGESPIAIATYGGARRNPVRLHRSVWPLLATTGDEGARTVIGLRPELVEEIPCPGSAADIDTLEDLQSWQNRSSTNSP